MLVGNGTFAPAPSPSCGIHGYGLSHDPCLSVLGFLFCSLHPHSPFLGLKAKWKSGNCYVGGEGGSEPQDWQHTWRPQATEQAQLHISLLNLPQTSPSRDPPLLRG